MQGIYSISSKKTNTVYIGQSIDVDQRILRHKNDLSQNNHENRYLQRYYNKYGIGELEFLEIICGPFDKEELTELEQFYMDKYKTEGKKLFNILTATGSRAGIPFSEEHKRKMSNAHKGIRHSEEAKKKISLARTGMIFSESHKNKLSCVHKNKKHSQETINKISKRMKGNKNALGSPSL